MSQSAKHLLNLLRAATKPYGSISELARKAALKPPQLQRYLSGETSPSLETLDRLAEALGIHPWEMIKPTQTEEVRLSAGVREAIREELARTRNEYPPREYDPAHPLPHQNVGLASLAQAAGTEGLARVAALASSGFRDHELLEIQNRLISACDAIAQSRRKERDTLPESFGTKPKKTSRTGT